jgi:quinol-cytochrome oxidoreductase complex cytochrome b subunit
MNEIVFAFKCVIAFLLVLLFGFFATYFIFANDHMITVYLNPIYFSQFSGRNREFLLPAWQFAAIASLVGAFFTYIICQIKFYKKNTVIDNLSKENAGLKSKFEKVKTDVSKCVT